MPRWKSGAKEFTVKVNADERRGSQVNLPKPVAEHLGNPAEVTFKIGKLVGRPETVTVEAGKV